MSKTKAAPARRIIELDLLRGFFIIVITLDHLQFWPSAWQYLTGQGRLWVSAAEGFFIVSGLLIGYLRAYKESAKPLKDIALKLWKRAGLLWLWCVIITLAVIGLSVAIPGNTSLLPKMPDPSMTASAWTFLANIITMNYASDWIYFLRLYAFMLAITPLFLWLLRKQKVLIAISLSLGIYLFSLVFNINEVVLQWQLLFFGAALVGWKFESILAWFNKRPVLRAVSLYSLIAATLLTMTISYFMVHGWAYVDSPTTNITRESYTSIRSYVDPVFSNSPLTLTRIMLSFVCIFGLLGLFHLIRRPLNRLFGWLLATFGTASLTAYCLQAVLLVPIVKLVQLDGGFAINTVFGAAVLLIIWALMKIPLVQKILPK